ncbi:MAG: response regulator [bacterium]
MNKKERLEKGLLKLGEIADEFLVSLGTIRHYSNLGLILPEDYTPGKFRLFDRTKTHDRLSAIHKLISQGMSLDQIQTELSKPSKRKEVLIVDDEKDVTEVFQTLLKEKDINTRVVHDGFGAGQALGESVPDLVILDLHLPGMDGFEICKRIKQNANLVQTKILAITGYDTPENAQKIISSGADAYLSKPFDIDNLEKKINELLGL